MSRKGWIGIFIKVAYLHIVRLIAAAKECVPRDGFRNMMQNTSIQNITMSNSTSIEVAGTWMLVLVSSRVVEFSLVVSMIDVTVVDIHSRRGMSKSI